MSVILPQTQTIFTISAVGEQVILPAANYAINEITIFLTNIVGSGDTILTTAIQTSSGTTTNLQQIIFTGSGSQDINQVIQRSFPSAVILPIGAELLLNTTELMNISVANVIINMTGYMY
jgi:hypothetical protein